MQTITIEIDETGRRFTVGAEGVDGPDCKKLTESIERALGDVESVRKTAEFHKPPKVLRKK
jgi:hypothetical protein